MDKIFLTISIISALITIFVLIAGKGSVKSLFKAVSDPKAAADPKADTNSFRKIFLVITVLSTIITIAVFITGKNSLYDFWSGDQSSSLDSKDYESSLADMIKSAIDDAASSQEEKDKALVENPISWEDKAFEKMIRTAIKEYGSIYPSDLQGIYQLYIFGDRYISLDDSDTINYSRSSYTINDKNSSSYGRVKTLADLKYFQNLEILVICFN